MAGQLPVIRVNTQVPFPAMVTGSGPITVGKVGGVWTVGFSTAIFAEIFGLLPSLGKPQRLAAASPVVVGSLDQIINVNISTGSPTCVLPLASSRIGLPVTFKDVAGHFAAHPLTITVSGSDTIDGQASITLGGNYQGITLVPANDGTTTGWSIE